MRKGEEGARNKNRRRRMKNREVGCEERKGRRQGGRGRRRRKKVMKRGRGRKGRETSEGGGVR